MGLETLFPNRFRKDRTTTRPTFTPEQKAQLESLCDGILQKEDFGRSDFNTFIDRMLDLLARPGHRVARLIDSQAQVSVNLIQDYSIEVRGGVQRSTHDPHVSYETLYQRVSYKPREVKSGRSKTEIVFQPTLTTDVNSPFIPPIQYNSYFSGKPEQASPNRGVPHARFDQFLTDKNVQDFCAKVHQLYLNNKAQTLPQLA